MEATAARASTWARLEVRRIVRGSRLPAELGRRVGQQQRHAAECAPHRLATSPSRTQHHSACLFCDLQGSMPPQMVAMVATAAAWSSEQYPSERMAVAEPSRLLPSLPVWLLAFLTHLSPTAIASMQHEEPGGGAAAVQG